MKMTWQRIASAVAVIAVIVPAAWTAIIWISTRAHAEEVEIVQAQVSRTADAVEGLTMIVYMDQLKHAREELAELRIQKQRQAVTWSADDEAELLDIEARIRNLQTELDEMLKAKTAAGQEDE